MIILIFIDLQAASNTWALEIKAKQEKLKPAFRLYNDVQSNIDTYSLYIFPTTGNIIDHTKNNAEIQIQQSTLDAYIINYSS